MSSRRARIATFHFAISLTIVLICAAIVFLLWYPAPLASLAKVGAVFAMVAFVDLILGPTIGFIVASPKKKRRELLMDLSIVGMVQIAALGYGMNSVFDGRPVYAVYNVGRIDVVFANEFEPAHLAKAPMYGKLPLLGPVHVGARLPEDIGQRNAITFSALEGGADLPQMPEHYVELAELRSEMVAAGFDVAALKKLNPGREAEIDASIERQGRNPDGLRFLITKVKTAFVTTAIDARTGEPIKVLDFVSWIGGPQSPQ